MSTPQAYEREKDGQRFIPGGINTVLPLDKLPPNKYGYLANVRAYRQQQIIGRSTVGAAIISGLPAPVHSLRILNDTTPAGPSAGYVRIVGAAGTMWVNSTEVATGLSGSPVSILPFRPNTSVQPWAYIGDGSENVTITTKYLINGTPTTFPTNGAIKIRSDALTFKTGIKEPQLAPTVSTQNYTSTGTDALPATTIPWTNVGGVNTSYNYGQTNAADGTAPVVITGGGPFLVAGASVTLVVTGTATVNGATHAPGDAGPTSASFPGAFIAGAKIVVGAFTDASGNVVPPGGSLPLVFPVGAGTTVIVPENAAQLQIGIDSSANTFSANSGAYSVAWSVTVSAIATVISTVGEITAYVWGTPPPAGGGSPHSGPVASYIWKNPNDSGSGTPRSITDPVPDASPTNNSWVFDSTPEDGTVPVNWNVLNPDGSVASTIPLFDPALESEGYQDFNTCIVGSLFVPAAGTYSFTLKYKDQIMFSIGGGATAAYASGSTGSTIGSFGQKISVVNALPILFVSTANGSGAAKTTTLSVTFPGTGVYQVEIDWDYWEHTGRSLIMTIPSSSPNSPTIPPLPSGVRTNVQYRYVYRSSATGALSNPSPESALQATPVLANEVTSIYSPDPQVDKVDYYRIDGGLINFTYVATGPNDGLGGTVNGVVFNTPIEDELTDIDVAANQILQFDNFEPFPVIDLPRKGVVNVTGGVITWVSGDLFNIRWLPGTEILIGYPTSLSYVFISRPFPAGFHTLIAYALGQVILDPAGHYQQVTIAGTSGGTTPTFNDTGGTTTSGSVTFQDVGTIFAGNGYVTEIALPDVPDGTNLVYEIPEPDLAAQPLPYVWGPTDNTNYYFGVGDKLNPGTLYFTKGNNPDSAPQTNQISVTSPSDALINGVKTAAMGMVWTTEKRWLIYDTFTQALATVDGVAGQPFNVVEATGSRGLYIAPCVTTDGGMTAFFRAKDGIYASPFGGQDEFICADIYNLFPREGVVPQPVTIAGFTIFPPDDTKPTAQKLSYGAGYLFYDYEDTTGTPRTLVFDQIAGGWSVDVGQFPFQSHAWEEGPQTNTFMVGCSDGTVRVLGSGNSETCTSVVIPGCQNAGDARAFKRIGDVFVKATAATSNPILVALYANRYAQALTGFTPTSLIGTGSLQSYIIDFSSGFGSEVIDVGIVLRWPTASADLLDLWQPSLTFFPEATQDRPTSWGDLGSPGMNFVQGLVLEINTFGVAKTFSVEDEKGVIHTPSECPVTANGQQKIAFTFTPPFTSHIGRIVSTDGVPWRMWGPGTDGAIQWASQPYPESTVEWDTELTSLAGTGWQHLRLLNLEYSSTAPVTLTFTVDTGNGSIVPNTLTIPSSGGTQTKLKLTVSANKWKLLSFNATSSAPITMFVEGFECWVKNWGSSSEYRKIKPWGGPSSPAAEL